MTRVWLRGADEKWRLSHVRGETLLGVIQGDQIEFGDEFERAPGCVARRVSGTVCRRAILLGNDDLNSGGVVVELFVTPSGE